MENLEKTLESKKTLENNIEENIKQARKLLPTEFLAVDPMVNMSVIGDTELRLQELTPKIIKMLNHLDGNNAGHLESPEATTEEANEFANLLRGRGSDYRKFALLLDSVANTENDPDRYLVDKSNLENDTKENIKQARKLLPTEFLAIDPMVNMSVIGDAELRLQELTPKIISKLDSLEGNNGVSLKGPEATTEESQEFANLLREKGDKYSEFNSFLYSVVGQKINPDKYLI